MGNKYSKTEHVATKGELNQLKPTLERWLMLQKKYSTKVGGDFLSNYRERTCVGFLAAAAWKTEGLALEEWRTTKTRNGKNSYGRCDLWIKTKMGNEFCIEARHRWMGITMRDPKAAAEKGLQDAINEAKRNRWAKDLSKVGILFIGVCSRHDPDDVQKQKKWILQTVCAVLNSAKDSAVAWLFPSESKSATENSWRTFGIIMLAKTTR